jgi:hypothetical protein
MAFNGRINSFLYQASEFLILKHPAPLKGNEHGIVRRIRELYDVLFGCQNSFGSAGTRFISAAMPPSYGQLEVIPEKPAAFD